MYVCASLHKATTPYTFNATSSSKAAWCVSDLTNCRKTSSFN